MPTVSRTVPEDAFAKDVRVVSWGKTHATALNPRPREYWTVERRQKCNCPDCYRLHWYQEIGTSDKGWVLSEARRMANGKEVRIVSSEEREDP